MEVEVEKPHLHHQPTGNRWLDLGLPIGALFVSLVSIFIAWHHSHIMRELVHQNERIVEAESLPYLDIYTSDLSADDKTPALRLSVQNQGIGPARIAEVTVTVNGKPVPDFNTLIDRCCAPGLLQSKDVGNKQFRGIRSGDVTLSSLRDRMIRPGEVLDAFVWPATDANRPILDRLERGLASDEITVAVCYCSVFDDCWVRADQDRRPTQVNQCAIPPVPYRQ